MAKYKINLIGLLLLFSFPLWGGKKQCASLKSEIKRIQKSQTSHKAFGSTVGELQKSYDENIAQFILLKGLKEMKDNFWRAKGKLQNTNPLSGELAKRISRLIAKISLKTLKMRLKPYFDVPY